MTITQNDVNQILKIIDAAEHIDEVELIVDGLRLHIRRSAQSGGAPVSPDRAERVAIEKAPKPTAPLAEHDEGTPSPARAAASSTEGVEKEVPPGLIGIRAPMLGSFYRSPAPGEKPFVEIGQTVRAGDTVCLIEVMKLFNSIEAGVDGKVVRIVAEDGGLVEYDQVLILIKPDSAAV